MFPFWSLWLPAVSQVLGGENVVPLHSHLECVGSLAKESKKEDGTRASNGAFVGMMHIVLLLLWCIELLGS